MIDDVEISETSKHMIAMETEYIECEAGNLDESDEDSFDECPGDEICEVSDGNQKECEIDREVLNHLLFHQAIGDGAINIDKYIEILKGITEGDHLTMVDPRDRTTALVFELIIKENFNPWEIDLKVFADSYLARLTGDLDFITAGRLIFMAYRILRLQSTELLDSLSEPDDDFYDDSMDIEGWMEEDASYIYTRRVVEMKQPPIEESVMHRGDRRVTLFELVEAFDEAAKEAEDMREHNNRMREERNRLSRLRRSQRKHVGDQVHDEDYKEDIRKVFTTLLNFNVQETSFSKLRSESPVDDLTTFISLLFLNFEEKIQLEQKDYPFGDIQITIPTTEETPFIDSATSVVQELASIA